MINDVLRMCPACRDWLDDEAFPLDANVCDMCAKGVIWLCEQIWMASRIEAATKPVEHRCEREVGHDDPCRCSCGAVK